MPTDTAIGTTPPAGTSAAPARPREGGDALVNALARNGVVHLFSVSGGPINSAYYATTRHPVQIVHVRHEAAAGFMADAVYRSTGAAGAVLATLGPGVTNVVTPAACALASGVPMLIIGGQASTAVLDRGAGMELDTMAAMGAVTKWSARVLHADRIDEYVDEAWRRMMAGTPGPVYLEIPVDVLSRAVPETGTAGGWFPPAAPAPGPEVVDRVRGLLDAARRPLIIAGDGIFHGGSAEELRTFVAAAQAPVMTLRLARGAVDEAEDPWFAGPAYVPANPVVAEALASSDLVLLLGHHWEFDLEYGAALGEAAAVVQVHRDAAFIGRNGRADVGICADPGLLLAALGPLRTDARDTAWTQHVPARWRAVQDGLTVVSREPAPADDPRVHPLLVVDEVVRSCPPGTRFVTSHGNVDFWADPRIPVRGPGRYLRVGQSGALGAEVPFGVGAAIADPTSACVVFLGDGAVGYHVTEIETAVRSGAPVVLVVLDDNRWGAISMPQRNSYGVEVALDLPERDWAAVARGLGATGARAAAGEVGRAVADAIAVGGPALFQVPVRPVLSPYMEHLS